MNEHFPKLAYRVLNRLLFSKERLFHGIQLIPYLKSSYVFNIALMQYVARF